MIALFLSLPFVLFCLTTNLAHGEDDSVALKPKVIGPRVVKTAYKFWASSADVTTTVSGQLKGDDKLLDAHLFPTIKRSLESTPFVTNVLQAVGGGVTSEKSWGGSITNKRLSSVFVTININSPVTFLFKVEESFTECPKEATYCTKGSSVEVNGPYAIYGNFASSVNVDALMREKQKIKFQLSPKDEGLQLTSSFSVESIGFEDSLSRLFKVFNFPSFLGGSAISPTGSAMNTGPLTSRHRMFLGISRILRQTNERIINP